MQTLLTGDAFQKLNPLADQPNQSPHLVESLIGQTHTNAEVPRTSSRKTKLRFATTKLVSSKSKPKNRSKKGNRPKRHVGYGTLETIDEKQLNELRKTYKNALKEITLQSHEDPTETLMRHNAASIQEALESETHSQEPLEISSGDYASDAQGIEQQNQIVEAPMPSAYSNFNQQSLGHFGTNALIPINRNRVSIMPRPISVLRPTYAVSPKFAYDNNGYAAVSDNMPQSNLYTTERNVSPSYYPMQESYKVNPYHKFEDAKLKENPKTKNDFSIKPELQSLLSIIESQMSICCHNCKQKILASIRDKLRERSSQQRRGGNHGDMCIISDEEHENWLKKMAAKGYDTKYLTKKDQCQMDNNSQEDIAESLDESAQALMPKFGSRNSDQPFKRGAMHYNYIPKDKVKAKDMQETKITVLRKYKAPKNHTDLNVTTPSINSSTTAACSTEKSLAASSTSRSAYILKDDVLSVNNEFQNYLDTQLDVPSNSYTMRGKFVPHKYSAKSYQSNAKISARKFGRPKGYLKPHSYYMAPNMSKNSKNSAYLNEKKIEKMYKLVTLLQELSANSMHHEQQQQRVIRSDKINTTTMPSAMAVKPEINSTSLINSKSNSLKRSKRKKSKINVTQEVTEDDRTNRTTTSDNI